MKDVLQSIQAWLIPSPEDNDENNRSLTANLCHAQKQLRKVKCKADQLRKQHLEKILNEARSTKQQKKTAALTYLIRAEQNCHCYAALHKHTKPKSAGGLAYITTESEPSQPPVIIIDREDMDDTLLEYCQKHFATEQGMPFTTEPLSHLLQYDGITVLGNLISQGQAPLEELPLDEPTKALLTHLKSKDKAKECLHPLVYEELQNGIKKWPKKTTMSPSGWHLGIYKSLQKHVLSKAEVKALPPEEAQSVLKHVYPM